MARITISGYAFIVDDTHIMLRGDNTIPFSHLCDSYWSHGICRHVNSSKNECTFKTNTNTTYEKNGAECKRADLAGCHVIANVSVKKYSFHSPQTSKKIQGWQMTAMCVKQQSPLT